MSELFDEYGFDYNIHRFGRIIKKGIVSHYIVLPLKDLGSNEINTTLLLDMPYIILTSKYRECLKNNSHLHLEF